MTLVQHLPGTNTVVLGAPSTVYKANYLLKKQLHDPRARLLQPMDDFLDLSPVQPVHTGLNMSDGDMPNLLSQLPKLSIFCYQVLQSMF